MMKFLTITKKSSFILIVCLVLLFAGAITQTRYDKIMHPHFMFTTETKYILPSSVITHASFGFKNILADLYWVKAIQDFSTWDGKDPFYAQEYKNIATLDPFFSYPYLLGILTFTSRATTDKNAASSTLNQIEPVIAIGMKTLPKNWEIPFYMGTGYQLNKMPEKALYYLKIAAEKELAPERVKSVYTSYLKRTLTGDNAAKEFIKTIYETTESETTKKILEDGIATENLTQVIQMIAASYKNKFGVYPRSVDDLMAAKMILHGDALQARFTIKISRTTGKVEVTAKKIH